MAAFKSVMPGRINVLIAYKIVMLVHRIHSAIPHNHGYKGEIPAAGPYGHVAFPSPFPSHSRQCESAKRRRHAIYWVAKRYKRHSNVVITHDSHSA